MNCQHFRQHVAAQSFLSNISLDGFGKFLKFALSTVLYANPCGTDILNFFQTKYLPCYIIKTMRRILVVVPPIMVKDHA